MVGVAQSVERRIVIPVVVGSIPIVHPIFRMAESISYPALIADVVELVDTPDLGSGAARCESSSLSVRTIQKFLKVRVISVTAPIAVGLDWRSALFS